MSNYLKEYYLLNREKIINNSKKNYLKNRDKILARNKRWVKSPHGRTMRLAKKFSISYKAAQKWLKITHCQICKDNLAIATDHDHKTGKVRGRLCYRCNRAMGAFHDSIRILSKAINYLKKGEIK